MLFVNLLVISPAPGVDMWHLSYTRAFLASSV